MNDVQLQFNSYFISLDERAYKFPESEIENSNRECNPTINLNKVLSYYKHPKRNIIIFEFVHGNVPWYFTSENLRDKVFEQIKYYTQEVIE